MDNRPTQPNEPSEPKPFPERQDSATDNGERLGWLLLEFVPIPIGLLTGSIHIFDSIVNGTKGLFIVFATLTLACSVIGAIGQWGGFKKAGLGRFAAGVFVGIWIGVFDITVVFFTGCCSAIGHINR
jgi:hypothetical protein